MDSSEPQRKPGRRSKGARVQVPVRMPASFHARIEQIAKRDNLPLTDVVTRMIAESLGVEAPDYCRPRADADQQELPLNQAS